MGQGSSDQPHTSWHQRREERVAEVISKVEAGVLGDHGMGQAEGNWNDSPPERRDLVKSGGKVPTQVAKGKPRERGPPTPARSNPETALPRAGKGRRYGLCTNSGPWYSLHLCDCLSGGKAKCDH